MKEKIQICQSDHQYINSNLYILNIEQHTFQWSPCERSLTSSKHKTSSAHDLHIIVSKYIQRISTINSNDLVKIYQYKATRNQLEWIENIEHIGSNERISYSVLKSTVIQYPRRYLNLTDPPFSLKEIECLSKALRLLSIRIETTQKLLFKWVKQRKKDFLYQVHFHDNANVQCNYCQTQPLFIQRYLKPIKSNGIIFSMWCHTCNCFSDVFVS